MVRVMMLVIGVLFMVLGYLGGVDAYTADEVTPRVLYQLLTSAVFKLGGLITWALAMHSMNRPPRE